MIIDSHAHIFEKWSGSCGLPDSELHLRYIQKAVTSSAAKSFRLRDGAPSDAGICYRDGVNSWAAMRDDVNFRVGPYGRLEFVVDGEVHYVQYMPVDMAEIESTPELMISHMNAAGVDHCVLQAGFSYGYMNDYNALAQRQFPHRFTGLFHVDEARADTAFWMSETCRAIEQLGLKGLYYHVGQFTRYDFDTWYDDRRFDEFWQLIDMAGVPVFFDLAAFPANSSAEMVSAMDRLSNLMDRFQKIAWVLVMSPPAQFFAQRGEWRFPDTVLQAYKRENVWLEICFPISWGGIWDYPYPEAQRLIEGLHKLFGAEKLVWGSDMPNVGRFCTYKQSLDYVRRHCDFLSEREMDRILGGNLASLLQVPARPVS